MSRLNHFQTRPKVAPIALQPYLEKLGLRKELPSLNYLRQLHRAHLLHIPVENLDIHFRKKITPDIRSVYKKIIPNRRGGIANESNLLFYHLLTHLGYDCMPISAHMFQPDTDSYGPEYDHMALLVRIQHDIYLCDVGLGEEGIIYPKKLEEGALQMDHNRYFRLETDPDGIYYLRRTNDTLNFQTVYRFEVKAREPIEFLDRLNYHQSDPQSRFTGHKFVTCLTPDGRTTLTDRELMIAEKGEVRRWPVLNDDDFYTKMEECFGIEYRTLLHG